MTLQEMIQVFAKRTRQKNETVTLHEVFVSPFWDSFDLEGRLPDECVEVEDRADGFYRRVWRLDAEHQLNRGSLQCPGA